MPEIAGQRIAGSPLSERDLYQLTIAGFQQSINALRGLALSRNDMRYLAVVQILDRTCDNVKKLMVRREQKLIWLPERTGRDS